MTEILCIGPEWEEPSTRLSNRKADLDNFDFEFSKTNADTLSPHISHGPTASLLPSNLSFDARSLATNSTYITVPSRVVIDRLRRGIERFAGSEKQQQLSAQLIPALEWQYFLEYNVCSSGGHDTGELPEGINSNTGQPSNTKQKRKASTRESTPNLKKRRGNSKPEIRTVKRNDKTPGRRLLCPFQVRDPDTHPDCKCFEGFTKLNDHLRDKHIKIFQCEICNDYRCSKQGHMIRHQKTCKGNPKSKGKGPQSLVTDKGKKLCEYIQGNPKPSWNDIYLAVHYNSSYEIPNTLLDKNEAMELPLDEEQYCKKTKCPEGCGEGTSTLGSVSSGLNHAGHRKYVPAINQPGGNIASSSSIPSQYQTPIAEREPTNTPSYYDTPGQSLLPNSPREEARSRSHERYEYRLERWENRLEGRENRLEERENRLEEREKLIAIREQRMDFKEQKLNELEMKQREKDLKQQSIQEHEIYMSLAAQDPSSTLAGVGQRFSNAPIQPQQLFQSTNSTPSQNPTSPTVQRKNSLNSRNLPPAVNPNLNSLISTPDTHAYIVPGSAQEVPTVTPFHSYPHISDGCKPSPTSYTVQGTNSSSSRSCFPGVSINNYQSQAAPNSQLQSTESSQELSNPNPNVLSTLDINAYQNTNLELENPAEPSFNSSPIPGDSQVWDDILKQFPI
ncbi:hypothetical protein EDC01DRAFT_634716 [Geopyxis carbonaria]|nr:hypothetical protein EDC01DRAFT_634716 [Geopyxis carbonaria]